jgi:hypothetical protein
MKARQQARGWDNSVHVRMQSLMSKINLETSQPSSKHSRFERAYRTLAREEFVKAKKKVPPKFEVNLALLYGEVGDTAEI